MNPRMGGPLAHLRVVDCTDLRGAFAGRLFADVVRIERPATAAAPRAPADLYRNLGKTLVALDLHAADDAARFAALCAGADVLIENFGVNRRQVLDLAPEAVRARHPHLVHVALADFGLDGPRARWRAEPLVAFAGSGALFASGFPDRPPCPLPGFAAHDCAAVLGVAGALVALLARTAHGTGQTVEVSVQEAAISGFYPWAIPLADYHRLYPMIPTAPPRAADGTYLVLPVADGYVRILPVGRRHWRGFVELLDRADAFAAPEWDLPIFRMLNGDAIRLIAADALAGRTRADVFAEALRRGVPLAPVQMPAEFVASPQGAARGSFRRLAEGPLADAPIAAPPFRFARTPLADTPRLPAARPAAAPAWAPQPVPTATAPVRQPPPLAGQRVVVFGYAVVAPELGTLLAELGADVLRIESRAGLDLLRQVTVEPDTPNRAFTFNDASRGQRSVCLDLNRPRGRELALALCERADLVVENYRGGALRAHGITYEAVAARRPAVIWLSSQGFGATGPLAEASAFGPLNAAYAGVHWLWSDAGAPYPAGTALNHPDHLASRLAAVAVLAALAHRTRTGDGQYIDLAQTEAAAYLAGEQYLEPACSGRPPRQGLEAFADAVPQGLYPCASTDRWLAISVTTDAAWQRLERALGWAPDAALATLAGRRAARKAITARLRAWTQTQEPEAAAATLQAAGVSALPVLGPDDLRDDPHLLARDAILTVEHPEIGPERHLRTPLRLSGTALRDVGPAPLLGADTVAVLTEVLGLSRADAERLVADGTCS